MTPFLKRLEDFIFSAALYYLHNYRTDNNNWFCPECLNYLLTNSKIAKAAPVSSKFAVQRLHCEFGMDFHTSIRSFLDYDEKYNNNVPHQIFQQRTLHFTSDLFRFSLKKAFEKCIILSCAASLVKKFKRGYTRSSGLPEVLFVETSQP